MKKYTLINLFLLTAFVLNSVIAASLPRPINPDIGRHKKIHKPLPKFTINKVTLKEYIVPAALAWGEAKRQGFKFYPAEASGRKDGNNTWGVSYYRDSNNRLQKAERTAKLSAGILLQMSTIVDTDLTHLDNLGAIDSYSLFHFFQGKKLRPNWTVKSIDFGGTYSFDKRIRSNSNSAYCVVKVTISGNGILPGTTGGFANFKEIVLIGPSNGKWQDAFDVD